MFRIGYFLFLPFAFAFLYPITAGLSTKTTIFCANFALPR